MNVANASPKVNIINILVNFLLDFSLYVNKIAIIKYVQFSFLPQGSYRCNPLGLAYFSVTWNATYFPTSSCYASHL